MRKYLEDGLLDKIQADFRRLSKCARSAYRLDGSDLA